MQAIAHMCDSADPSILKFAAETLVFRAGEGGSFRDEMISPLGCEALRKLIKTGDSVCQVHFFIPLSNPLPVTRSMFQFVVVTALHEACKKEPTWDNENDDSTAMKRLHLQTQGGLSKQDADAKFEEVRKKAREKENENERFRKKFCESKDGVLAVLCALTTTTNSSSSSNSSSSIRQAHLLAETFKTLAEDKDNRGPMVRDGAVRCLLAACARLRPVSSFSNADKVAPASTPLPNVVGPDVEGNSTSNLKAADVADVAAHALAKIMVTTNPTLLPHEHLLGLTRHLPLLMSSSNQLAQFESALALTNVVSIREMRAVAVGAGAWRQLEYLAASENTMVQVSEKALQLDSNPDHNSLLLAACGGGRLVQLGNERHDYRAHAGHKRRGPRALHEDLPCHCSQPRRTGGRVLARCDR
jgi:hypothetical protein